MFDSYESQVHIVWKHLVCFYFIFRLFSCFFLLCEIETNPTNKTMMISLFLSFKYVFEQTDFVLNIKISFWF